MHTRSMQRILKKSLASVFHFLHLAFWFDRGAGTKNSNSTSPPPLLLCCCCCPTAAVLLKNIALPLQAFQRVKISQGDAELKGFVKCCWCCAAPSAAPHDPRFWGEKCSASVFHFLHLAFWFAPGCCDEKQQLHGAAARRGALTSNLAWV